MAIGGSGRVVLEIEPELKRKLYACLALEQRTLKDWFIVMAENHIKQNTPELHTKVPSKK